MDEVFAATTVAVDEAFCEMMTWAVRYALGRQSYAVGDTVSYIKPLIVALDNRSVCCMQRDIANQEQLGGYGMDCDKAQWMSLLEALDKEIDRRGIERWR